MSNSDVREHVVDNQERKENQRAVPSGNLTYYWKWPFIVSFPIKNGDFP